MFAGGGPSLGHLLATSALVGVGLVLISTAGPTDEGPLSFQFRRYSILLRTPLTVGQSV